MTKRKLLKRRGKLTTTFVNPDTGLEFEFFLATELHKTVKELREQMSLKEFLYWGIYYGRRAQERELAKG